ncbi:MAG: AraC family transcriptional regulator [Bacteroidia bacterium]|nr:AraC family transcriptional regulator [Bacteroidia bacterium]
MKSYPFTNLQPRLVTLEEKKLIGLSRRMSFQDNQTGALWRSFMPRRQEIVHRASTDLISMQIYDQMPDFNRFDPARTFTKWAAAEVTDFEIVPEGMETFILPGGLYAVFPYQGPASGGPQIFGYIYGSWMPASGYVSDHRPQFEVLGAGYKGEAPDSEEEIWIPVRKRGDQQAMIN